MSRAKVMPIKAQKLILRMYTLHELGEIWRVHGKWDHKKQLYAGCCNKLNKEQYVLCTLAPNHDGPHIAHAEHVVVGAWLNEGEE